MTESIDWRRGPVVNEPATAAGRVQAFIDEWQLTSPAFRGDISIGHHSLSLGDLAELLEDNARLFQLWQAENEEQTAVRVRAQRLANERDEARGETRLALALLHSAEDECDRYKAALEAMVARHPDAVPGEHPAVDMARAALAGEEVAS